VICRLVGELACRDHIRRSLFLYSGAERAIAMASAEVPGIDDIWNILAECTF
jgi:hypothetical protein